MATRQGFDGQEGRRLESVRGLCRDARSADRGSGISSHCQGSAGCVVERCEAQRDEPAEAVILGDRRVAKAFDQRTRDARSNRGYEVDPIRREARGERRDLDDERVLAADSLRGVLMLAALKLGSGKCDERLGLGLSRRRVENEPTDERHLRPE